MKNIPPREVGYEILDLKKNVCDVLFFVRYYEKFYGILSTEHIMKGFYYLKLRIFPVLNIKHMSSFIESQISWKNIFQSFLGQKLRSFPNNFKDVTTQLHLFIY